MKVSVSFISPVYCTCRQEYAVPLISLCAVSRVCRGKTRTQMQETEKASGSGAGFPQNNPRYHVTCAAHLPSIPTIQETVFYVPHGLLFSFPLITNQTH